jgi:hypothetical protein
MTSPQLLMEAEGVGEPQLVLAEHRELPDVLEGLDA